MICSFKKLRNKYTYREIKKLLEENKIYKIEKGIYSDNKNVNYLELINFKYPNAVFTLDSAFYYHNLTDVIPEKNVLAIKRDSCKYIDSNIRFVSYSPKYFDLGKATTIVDGVEIKIYDKERMLIELIRNRKSYGFDYYKEIINNYRELREQLDMGKITDYISVFPIEEHLYDVIMKEVF